MKKNLLIFILATLVLGRVAWAASQQLVVVGGPGGIILTAPNATSTWSSQNPMYANVLSITYANSEFVAVGLSGTVITSPDGVTWTTQTSGTTNTLYALACSVSLLPFDALGIAGD